MHTIKRHILPFFPHSDVVALKGGFFTSASSGTDILQRDLLCSGSEENLLECTEYGSGTRDCPADHTEDAGVKCNGVQCCNKSCIVVYPCSHAPLNILFCYVAWHIINDVVELLL